MSWKYWLMFVQRYEPQIPVDLIEKLCSLKTKWTFDSSHNQTELNFTFYK